MNIIAINGSGRPLGNNYHILNTCLNSFDKTKNTTELIQLSNLTISGCKSCYSCKTNSNHCIIKDDMTTISQKVLKSDILILSSPIYMWQISAQTKAFMERLYPFFHFDKPSDLKGKKLILIFTQASTDKMLFETYFQHIKSSMIFLGFDVVDLIVYPELRNPDDYTKHPKLLNKLSSLATKYV